MGGLHTEAQPEGCWPEDDGPDRFTFSDFAKYLKLNTRQNAEESRKTTISSLKRFLVSLKLPDGDIHPVAVMCSVHKHNIFDKLSETGAWDIKATWTRQMIGAVTDYVNYLITVCNREKWNDHKTTLHQLLDDSLAGFRKGTNLAKSDSDFRKKMADTARLEDFPATDLIKQAVKLAMVRLWLLRNVCKEMKAEALPMKLKVEAATAIVGIICFNSFPGRSGEWVKMLRTAVWKQWKKGASYIVCVDHKTVRTYGELAKFIPAGSWEAFRVYIDLPFNTDLFLAPVTPESTKISFSYFLKRFGYQYMKLNDPPNSNLIRKYYHSALMELTQMGKCLKLMKLVRQLL